MRKWRKKFSGENFSTWKFQSYLSKTIIFKVILERTENQSKHNIKDIHCMIKNVKVVLEYLEREFENIMLKTGLSLC